jgi:squalene-associated FAD-dependent desaturase
MKLAVIGAGWAGLAAAVQGCEDGHSVTVFEAARQPGGRARSLAVTLPDGRTAVFDNGQHILIGAYTDTLALMRRVGVDPDQALLRTPLALAFPDGSGLALPAGPAPLDALAGILRARGWTWRERLALLRTALGWQLGGFRCPPEASVAQLCAGLPATLRDGFIDPLCVSALNTPAADASGAVFLRVLRDALFGVRGGSNLLLPRTDLGALLPDAAVRWLGARGARVLTGQRVLRLRADGARWRIDTAPSAPDAAAPVASTVPGEPFDAVVLAAPAPEAARLAQGAADGLAHPHTETVRRWAATALALRHEAITTVYAQGDSALPRPMLALRASADAPAQFVFDRGALGGPAGLLAFVVSASTGERTAIEAQVVAQARAQLGLAVTALRTVTERRATFACTPGLQRPAARLAPGLVAAADYVEGPYPATLEGAVRSGRQAVSLI